MGTSELLGATRQNASKGVICDGLVSNPGPRSSNTASHLTLQELELSAHSCMDPLGLKGFTTSLPDACMVSI